MSVIRQQSRGLAQAGEDTDQPATSSTAGATADAHVWSGVTYEGEGGESEDERAEDQLLLNPDRDLTTRRGELEASVDDLRSQLNVALSNGHWSDADEIQRTIFVLLDNMHNYGMRDPDTRIRVFTRIADSFRWLAKRGERYRLDRSITQRYREFEDFYRSRT